MSDAEDRHLNHELKNPLTSDQPVIMGDYDLLLRLLENAVKFTRHDETIELRASAAGDQDELYRSQNVRAVPGSGIGLAMVKAIVERHGGRVALHRRPGLETVVMLWLPLSS